MIFDLGLKHAALTGSNPAGLCVYFNTQERFGDRVKFYLVENHKNESFGGKIFVDLCFMQLEGVDISRF